MRSARRAKQHAGESGFLGLSIRAWLALILVVSFCALCFLRPGLEEKLYLLVAVAIGFYYGSKPAPKTPNSELRTPNSP